jgi:hypothetical protein
MLALLVQQFGQHLGLHLSLALRLYAGTTLGPIEALAHAHAAAVAATDEVPPDLLLAVALVESRFDPYWVSRVENHKRRYSRYIATTPPKKLDRRAFLYCGPLQTRAATWDACLAQRDLIVAYRAGAAELTSWLHDKRVRGDVSRALAGYGCGNHGVRTGKCNRYQNRVLYQASRLSGTRHTTVQARARS